MYCKIVKIYENDEKILSIRKNQDSEKDWNKLEANKVKKQAYDCMKDRILQQDAKIKFKNGQLKME